MPPESSLKWQRFAVNHQLKQQEEEVNHESNQVLDASFQDSFLYLVRQTHYGRYQKGI